MGLDANIFFQGAALRQANDARTQATIGNFFDKLEAKKIREQDPERMLRQAVARKISGEATPEDEKLIQFESVLKGGETKYMPDEFGNVRAVTQPTLYDRLYGAGGQQPYQPQYPVMGEMSIPSIDMGSDAMPRMPADMSRPLTTADLSSDVFAGGEKGIDLNRIANARVENAARVNMPASDVSPTNAMVANSPKGAVKAFETDEAIRQKKAEADINVSTKKGESYATKTGQITAENEAKLPAIRGFIEELEAFGKEKVQKLPSGLAGSIAAKATNLAGVPNEQAIAQADLDSILPTLLAQAKQITRQAGEGTFTDYDAQALEKMIWNDSDSMAVKLSKYNTILDAMRRAENRILKITVNPTQPENAQTNDVQSIIDKYTKNK